MPITFDEISGQVAPERTPEPSAAATAESPAQSQEVVEQLRRALHVDRERQRRLSAD